MEIIKTVAADDLMEALGFYVQTYSLLTAHEKKVSRNFMKIFNGPSIRYQSFVLGTL